MIFGWGDRTFGAKRHPLWRSVRKAHLKRQPVCQISGKKRFLHVHHKIPVNINKTFELDDDNLVTLTRFWHFWAGHLGSWHSVNKDIDKDIKIWREKIQNRQ